MFEFAYFFIYTFLMIFPKRKKSWKLHNQCCCCFVDHKFIVHSMNLPTETFFFT